jgi:hypothetical protein
MFFFLFFLFPLYFTKVLHTARTATTVLEHNDGDRQSTPTSGNDRGGRRGGLETRRQVCFIYIVCVYTILISVYDSVAYEWRE